MREYCEYKDSHIGWIGEVPKHWEVKRLGSAFVENRTINSSLEITEAYKFNYGALIRKDEDVNLTEMMDTYCKYTCLNINDIVINGLNLNYDFVSQRVAKAYTKGIITSAYLILTPRDEINSNYYLYLLKSMDSMKLFHGMGTGIRLTLSYNEIKKQQILFPPLSEQQHIVSFLDKKTAKIDEYIDKKNKEIETLKEWKKALIAHVVTKGLNTNAKMKDSGVSWIGEIPEHWEVKTLRHYLKMVSVKGFPDETLLSVVREQGVIVRNTESQEENHNFIPDDLSGYKLVKKGQFAINKMKSWQGSYGVSQYQGIVSPAYYVCDLNFDNKRFFNEAIRSQVYIPFFTQYSKGIRVGQWDLSPIGLKSIPFIEPPIEEQQEIVEYIDAATTKADKMIVELTNHVESMKEYKQRLIADVVTGKINVQP